MTARWQYREHDGGGSGYTQPVAGTADDLAPWETAVAHWLVSGADDPTIPLHAWQVGRIPMLRAGVVFDAVRMPAQLVHAAVGTSHPDIVSASLTRLLGGPVICDPGSWYYALVPPRTAERHGFTHAVVRGRGAWLGVPRTDRTVPHPADPYWCVPAVRAGRVCPPEAVEALLQAGRAHLEKA